MRIGGALESRATTQIRMHRVPLDRPRADDGDLRDEIIHLRGLGARERLLLRATLDLEDADRVRRTHGAPDFGDLFWQRI